MKVKTFWFDDINHAEIVWGAYLADGWIKKERLKVKFNWKRMTFMLRFKLYEPNDQV